MRDHILERLTAIEQQQAVRVLLAVESGSRAWGFPSPNSDYDVRFVYARPRDWYLSLDLEERSDVIEHDVRDQLDLKGWDLRKALKLFAKSNPSFVEWLQSPIVYREDGPFARRARDLLPSTYSADSGVFHYLGMAERNYRGYLKARLVPLKKYLHTLCPLLAARWLEHHRTPVPVAFDQLRALVADDRGLDNDIGRLLARKQHGQEQEFVPVMPGLNDFIENELSRLSRYQPKADSVAADVGRLNDLFRDCLAQSPL